MDKKLILDWFTLFLIILNLLINNVHSRITFLPEVTVTEGRITGTIFRSRDGRPFFAFLGIPYGKAKRFELSVPPDKWTGIRDASSVGERCAQTVYGLMDGMDSYLGKEDCLFLNIYVPRDAMDGDSLPVLVYIHGGGYSIGSGSEYGANFMMDEDIILVTFNYRLGALGFLSTGDGEIEGNLGLKDQVLALKWIQKNIHKFGGNRRRVTISGESAGGGAIGQHLISPMSKGLFRAAIVQSGSSLCLWSLNYRPQDTARALAIAVNCPVENTREMAKCLKTTDTVKLMEPQAETRWFMEYKYPFFPSVELVQPKSGGERFLPDYPINLLKQGKFHKIPIVIGVTEDEGLMLSFIIAQDPEMMEDFNSNFTTVAPITFLFDILPLTPERLSRASMKIRDFYFGPGVTIKSGPEQQRTLTDLYSDMYFNYGVQTQAILHSKFAPVYPYIFTHKKMGSVLAFGEASDNKPAVTHGSELQYLFQMGIYDPADSETVNLVSRNMVKLFTSFVRTGKPTGTWGDGKIWEPVKYSDNLMAIDWYNISVNTMMIRKPFEKRMQFLKSVFEDELKFPQ